MKIRNFCITNDEKAALSQLKGKKIVALVSTGSETASDEDVFIRTEESDVRFHNTEKVPPSFDPDLARAVIEAGPIGSFRISWAKNEPENPWDETYWSIIRIDKIVRRISIYNCEENDSDCDGNEFLDRDTALIVFHFDDACLVLQHNLISIMWTMSYQDNPEVDFDKLFVIDGKVTKEVL
ncbi:MAG: hypothetical protein J6Z49_09775 [Kiritimatiellae bacterium]|nr:hypothetical protein [Kiritimatiellia bacterium]